MVQERSTTLHLELEAEPTRESDVFYNQDMVTNRDISTAAVQTYAEHCSEELRVLDALSASGVRALRYAQEVEQVTDVTANDTNPAAVENIQENIQENHTTAVTATEQDANTVLHENKGRFHVIDIDPFGTPIPFLDSAAQAMRRNGFLMVTATDLGNLCGTYPTKTRRVYKSEPVVPMPAFKHEIGLRILLKEVTETCARYDKAFTPRLSWYEQHYYRVTGTVEQGAQKADTLLTENIGYLTYCANCLHRSLNDTSVTACPQCGSEPATAGPLYTGRIADPSWVEHAANYSAENDWEHATTLLERLRSDAKREPVFYDSHAIADNLGTDVPAVQDITTALQEHGYSTGVTHFTGTGFRTDAPVEQVKACFQDVQR